MDKNKALPSSLIHVGDFIPNLVDESRFEQKLRIGILGTRGIPNHYGGFEQFAEYLSAGLTLRGHEVYVYNSHDHFYQARLWNNVHIVHCYDPSQLFGTFSQFIYDLNCIRDAAKRDLDVILILGYSSSSIWHRFFPKAPVIFNMDGLEWKRKKYKRPVQKFLKWAEKLAAYHGDYFIADSTVIKSYLETKYPIRCELIPYGAEIYNNEDEDLLFEYNILPYQYYLLIGRMEQEHNIETILDGYIASGSSKKFIVVGNTDNQYGKYLVQKFQKEEQIQFIGGIYGNNQKLHTLRRFCSLYFHGHSVGGTNPSLLEAMSSKALIAAHSNSFNKAVLGTDAFYFENTQDVKRIIQSVKRNEKEQKMIDANIARIRNEFSWRTIVDRYDDYIRQCFSHAQKAKQYQ